MEFSVRRERVLAALEPEVEAMVVTKSVNVRWLTGFTGSNGMLLVARNAPIVLFTDGRYTEQAEAETSAAGLSVELVVSRTNDADLAERLTRSRLGSCGVESHDVTLDRGALWAEAVPGVVFGPVGPLIDRLRQRKDLAEVERLQRAAEIADRALAAHEDAILGGGMTEREFARSLEAAMFEHGADGLSFETIVASGPNSSRPHARPTDRTLLAGDLVVIDFGASVDGYGSDMTRTLVIGGEPSDDQRQLYDAVAAAQAAGVATVRDGVDQVAVDRACRAVLSEHGLEEAFVHGVGHGIGLEIHEQPILSARSVGILSADLVVTVEPGAYVPARGGVRVEDSVVVTSDGCDPITRFPKGLVPWHSPRTT